MRHDTTEGRRAELTAMAGWMAVTLGAVHIVVVPLRRRENLSHIWADGWWTAFSLDEPTTLAESERALTFWQTLGSFGYPMLALGSHLVWSAHRGHRVPGWLGGIVLAWGLPFVTGMPGVARLGDSRYRRSDHRWRRRRSKAGAEERTEAV